jgi:hypothetical protein
VSDQAEPEPEPGYELLMPFVVVRSMGGPYDDEAWVAGYEMGQLDQYLASCRPEVVARSYVCRTDNTPQVDLLAMRYHWLIVDQTDHGDGWSTMQLRRMGWA